MFEFHFLNFKKQQDVINLFLFSTTIKTSNKSKDSGGIKKKKCSQEILCVSISF